MGTTRLGVHADVGVWLLDLDAPRTGDDLAVLSPDEKARADRLLSPAHRSRFVRGRAVLRRLLAQQVGAAPSELVFSYGPAGKPALAGAHIGRLQFNLAHSDRFGVVAVTTAGAVGIDLERVKPVTDVLRLGATAFSPAEAEALQATAVSERHAAFFAGWTRKEAYIKARGDGLETRRRFDVTLSPSEPPRLLRGTEPGDEDRWTLLDFTPVDGYVAALCVERRPRAS